MKLPEIVEEALEKREQRIIKELISFGFVEKTIHPFSKQLIYVVGNEDKTDEVEEFASKIARLKKVNVKLSIGAKK